MRDSGVLAVLVFGAPAAFVLFTMKPNDAVFFLVSMAALTAAGFITVKLSKTLRRRMILAAIVFGAIGRLTIAPEFTVQVFTSDRTNPFEFVLREILMLGIWLLPGTAVAVAVALAANWFVHGNDSDTWHT